MSVDSSGGEGVGAAAGLQRLAPPSSAERSPAAAPRRRRGQSLSLHARAGGGRRSSSIGCRSLLGRRSSAGLAFVACHDPVRLIVEINAQVALFRDLLIHIGQPRDCPELREKIRKLRRTCVDTCRHTSQLLLPQMRSAVAEGIPADNPHFVLLFFISQLFLRELAKCHRLVQVVPMDMSSFYENRPGPSNLGNVISQILLCKAITPDFNQEELCSISKDSADVGRIVQEMQEYMPQQENSTERNEALVAEDARSPWARKFYKNVGSFCCIRRPSYL